MITVLCGGVGAAKFLRALVEVVDPASIVAIVNTADDISIHGLHVSPDIDTIRYTLSGDVGERGWGRRDESWRAMEALDGISRFAPADSKASGWFQLGDRDLGVNLYRTQRLKEGAALSTVTSELTASAGLTLTILPVTDDRLSTRLTLEQDHREVDFQTYFVGMSHSVAVSGVRFVGADTAEPAPGVIDAISAAERIVIAPSNPIVSIGPLLAVPGVGDALITRRSDVVAISPIINGHALKGPADRLMQELGYEPSVVGVADLWSRFASKLFVDESDADIAVSGMQTVVMPTVMDNRQKAMALAKAAIA